jgi:hypothetical protein
MQSRRSGASTIRAGRNHPSGRLTQFSASPDLQSEFVGAVIRGHALDGGAVVVRIGDTLPRRPPLTPETGYVVAAESTPHSCPGCTFMT